MDEKDLLPILIPIMREKDDNPSPLEITLGDQSRSLLDFIMGKVGLSRDDTVYFLLSRGMLEYMGAHNAYENEWLGSD